MRVLSVEETRKIEMLANEYGVSYMQLMENAGSYCARIIRKAFEKTDKRNVLIICGKGKNGGDGFVIARKMWEYGCDVTVMLSQAVGEFEEKMVQKGLIPVITYPEEKVVLSADGRHLWRVFDNLLNNICKYAQPSTRVYINVDKNGQELNIIFKNISSSQLNISSEELMERFVRGDSSRNTEGSGLGLSIAKSLTELMNGRLELCVDGDLFKVTLVFPV